MHRAIVRLLLVAAILGACGFAKSDAEQAIDLINEGVALQAQGKLAEAEAKYFQTLERAPRNTLAYYNLGQVARGQNRRDAAEAWYRLALESDPNFVPALIALANVRAPVPGSVPEILDLYRRAIAIEPNNAVAHYNYGLNLRETSAVAEGEAEIVKGRQLDPSLPAVTPKPAAPRPSPTR